MTEWHNCYADGWQGELVPEAFSHPAKISRSLVMRIYQHAFSEGWLKAGDKVVDPFGGIAGTALDALVNGLQWVGVELEPKFVSLAEQNIDLWRRRYGGLANFGTAQILQGDSRQLCKVVQSGDIVISSPPYSNEISRDRKNENYAQTKKGYKQGGKSQYEIYGTTSGQLGAMKEGDFDSIVSSPPYASIEQSGGTSGLKKYGTGLTRGERCFSEYGTMAGQLGVMKEGDFNAIVSSPPYESNLVGTNNAEATRKRIAEGKFKGKRPDVWTSDKQKTKDSFGGGYSSTKENIGNQSGDTFWQSAKEIVAQCYSILKPQGHAIWVCKDFVRKGKRIPFSDQWQALCESQGFKLICRHKAMLVKEHGEQGLLDGGMHKLRTARKSFFRLLAEKKGSPPIDWEDVICLKL